MAIVFFSKRCDIHVFWTHVTIKLLMRLFGLNHRWRFFLMLWFLTTGWFWWFSKEFSWFLVGFHVYLLAFSLVFRVFHFFKFTIFNYATICWTSRADVFAMFSRFIDHHMQLFPMVTNHQSSDAMYRSNLFATLQAKEIIFLSNPGEWFSKFTMSFCWW